MTPAEAAAVLHDARLARRPVATLTSRWPGMTADDAYAVQAEGIRLREADGERVVGGKLGFTSAAMRAAMGVDHPNHGWLTDAMWLPTDDDGTGVVDLDRFIHPKVEPEIAFRLGSDLEGPDVTAADVLAATDAVAPCLEVVDSRYQGFRFAALDNIADDSSAGALVLGEPVDPAGIDLRLVGVVVTADGRVHATAAGAAAHDDPAAAVAWMAATCGRPLPAGSWVISGGLTTPVSLVHVRVVPDDPAQLVHVREGVTAAFDRLGPVAIRPATT